MNHADKYSEDSHLNAPEGFHEDFHRKLMLRIEQQEWAKEVPLLSTVTKPKDLNAPDGFFEAFPRQMMLTIPQAKIVRMRILRKTIIGLTVAAAIALFFFTLIRPESASPQPGIALKNVERDVLEFYISEELPYETDPAELTELLAVDAGSALTATSLDHLTEYIEQEIPYHELVSEF